MFDQITLYTVHGKQYEQTHGNPFDRGSADSYYGRPRRPHKGGVGGGVANVRSNSLLKRRKHTTQATTTTNSRATRRAGINPSVDWVIFWCYNIHLATKEQR